MLEYIIIETIDENGKKVIEKRYKMDGEELSEEQIFKLLEDKKEKKQKWVKCSLIEALDSLDNYIPVKVYFDVGHYYLNIIGYDIGDIGYKNKIYEDWEEFVADMEKGLFSNASYYYRNEE